jgi:hypothetical protein
MIGGGGDFFQMGWENIQRKYKLFLEGDAQFVHALVPSKASLSYVFFSL